MVNNEAVHQSMKRQLQEPSRRIKGKHIRQSMLWQTTSNINSIMKQLEDGASFDVPSMTDMVNTMVTFLNGTIRPAEEKV